MNSTFCDRLSYRFENFMAKGGLSIFVSLIVVFLLSFGLIILMRWLVLMAMSGSAENMPHHIWNIFLAMTDPGSMGVDSDASGWLKFTIILGGFFGVIIFSMLIAFITTGLERTVWEFRKGHSREIYDHIFQEEGSEIYLKPARLYFQSLPVRLSIADLIGQVLKRDEICLGLRRADLANNPEHNFGITLNMDKNQTIDIGPDDTVVVLAEDEL